MYVAYDSIDPSQIPASASVVAGYVGGRWPDYEAEVARWPHARHISIAVNASEDADMLDVETGDATPDEAPGWYRQQIARGAVEPIFYRELSGVNELVRIMEGAGIGRGRYRILSAHYTGVPHICGPHEGVVQCDGTQWWNKALGRDLDESLLADDFFHAAELAGERLDLLEPSERRLVNTFDVYVKHPHLHGHGLVVTRAAIKLARQAVWLAAEKGRLPDGRRVAPGWDVNARDARYRMLSKRVPPA